MKKLNHSIVLLFVLGCISWSADAVWAKDKDYLGWRKQKCIALQKRIAQGKPNKPSKPGDIDESKLKSVRWVAGTYKAISGKSWGRQGICEVTLKNGDVLFDDGCTASFPGKNRKGKKWSKFFFNACVYHDHCYHHNPSQYGRTRDTCDQSWKEVARALCRHSFQKGKGLGGCLLIAGTSHFFLRYFSSKRKYNHYNLPAHYQQLYRRDWTIRNKQHTCRQLLGQHRKQPICLQYQKIKKKRCYRWGSLRIRKGYCVRHQKSHYIARQIK